MSGHTPGPWVLLIEQGGSVDDSVHSGSKDAGEGDIVCLSPECGGYDRSADRWTANARLIAAAPELLAALQAAMAFIESHVADPDITGEMARRYAALQDANPTAAIRKATGETK